MYARMKALCAKRGMVLPL